MPQNNNHSKPHKLKVSIADKIFNKGVRTAFNRNFSDIFRESVKLFALSFLFKKYLEQNGITFACLFDKTVKIIEKLGTSSINKQIKNTVA